MAPMGLAQLVGERELQRLMGAHWPDRHFVSHGHDRGVRALNTISALQSPEALLAQWPDTGTAWPPRDVRQPSLVAPASQLLTLYTAGHTIYLTRVERHVPELLPWIRGVERDLELSRGAVFCEVLCSITGQGAKMHFDPNMTVNVQLRGRKTWTIAPNERIANPHEGGLLGDQDAPAHASSFDTAAGSVVFVPHGCWHATECAEPSMALLFTIEGNCWHSRLSTEADHTLRQHDVCRSIALVPPPGKKPRAQSRDQLLRSIEILKAWVNALDADELLRKWSGPPLTTFRLESRAGAPAGDAELLDWIEAQGGVFHTFDLVDAFSTIAPQDLLKRIWALESQGIIKAD